MKKPKPPIMLFINENKSKAPFGYACPCGGMYEFDIKDAALLKRALAEMLWWAKSQQPNKRKKEGE